MPTIIDLNVIDCERGLASLPLDYIDCAITSPPYNIGTKYKSYDDNRSVNDYIGWFCRWGRLLKDALKPNGSFFLNVGGSPSNPLLPHHLVIALSNIFTLQNTFHWIKSISIERGAEEISVGHFKPINSKRYVTDCHEYIYHFTKTGSVEIDRLAIGVSYVDKTNLKRWTRPGGNDKRCRGNNWYIPYETIQKSETQRPHPATFPIALAMQCLKVHGCNNESIILDPFMGIGNTAIAAERCGAGCCIGFDLDPDYTGVARSRVSEPQSSYENVSQK